MVLHSSRRPTDPVASSRRCLCTRKVLASKRKVEQRQCSPLPRRRCSEPRTFCWKRDASDNFSMFSCLQRRQRRQRSVLVAVILPSPKNTHFYEWVYLPHFHKKRYYSEYLYNMKRVNAAGGGALRSAAGLGPVILLPHRPFALPASRLSGHRSTQPPSHPTHHTPPTPLHTHLVAAAGERWVRFPGLQAQDRETRL